MRLWILAFLNIPHNTLFVLDNGNISLSKQNIDDQVTHILVHFQPKHTLSKSLIRVGQIWICQEDRNARRPLWPLTLTLPLPAHSLSFSGKIWQEAKCHKGPAHCAHFAHCALFPGLCEQPATTCFEGPESLAGPAWPLWPWQWERCWCWGWGRASRRRRSPCLFNTPGNQMPASKASPRFSSQLAHTWQPRT